MGVTESTHWEPNFMAIRGYECLPCFAPRVGGPWCVFSEYGSRRTPPSLSSRSCRRRWARDVPLPSSFPPALVGPQPGRAARGTGSRPGPASPGLRPGRSRKGRGPFVPPSRVDQVEPVVEGERGLGLRVVQHLEKPHRFRKVLEVGPRPPPEGPR